MKLRARLPSVVRAIFTMMMISGSAAAQDLTLNSMVFSSEDDWWKNYTYHSWDTVRSANRIVSWGGEKAHDILDMESRSPLARVVFLGTVGQIVTRASWANSVIGHEYAHFANAHRFGLTSHYFVDDDTGEQFDWQKAWLNSFVGGDPNGPATSRNTTTIDTARLSRDGVETSLAGLNWQMGYTEKFVRGWLVGDQTTVFDAPNFVLNRVYMTSYALGSYTGANGSEGGGDIGQFSKHMESKFGESDATKKVIITGLASYMLSPSFMQAGKSFGNYILDGIVQIEPYFFQLPSGDALTWDIPTFLNKDNMSVAPTLYWKVNPAQALNSDAIVLGFGVEAPAIGKGEPDVRLSLDGRWERFDLALAASAGKNGQYFEFEGNYHLSNGVGVSLGLAKKLDDTLRGARFLPDDTTAAWAGLTYKF